MVSRIQAPAPSNPFMRGVDISRRQRLQKRQIESSLRLDNLEARAKRAQLAEWKANEPVREIQRDVQLATGALDLEFMRPEREAGLSAIRSETAQREAVTEGQRLKNVDFRRGQAARDAEYETTVRTIGQKAALDLQMKAEEIAASRAERRQNRQQRLIDANQFVMDNVPQELSQFGASDYRRLRRNMVQMGFSPEDDFGLPTEYNDEARMRLRKLGRQATVTSEVMQDVETQVREAERKAASGVEDETTRLLNERERVVAQLQENPEDEQARYRLSQLDARLSRLTEITGRTEFDRLDESRDFKVKNQMMILQEENQAINHILSIIDNNPSSVGIVGSIRGGIQTARGLGHDIAERYTDNPLAQATNNMVTSAQQQIVEDYRGGGMDDDVYREYFDEDIAAIDYWNNILAYMHARTIMKPTERLNKDDIQNARNAVGLRGFRSSDEVRASLIQAQRQLMTRHENLTRLRSMEEFEENLAGPLEAYSPDTDQSMGSGRGTGERPAGGQSGSVQWEYDANGQLQQVE